MSDGPQDGAGGRRVWWGPVRRSCGVIDGRLDGLTPFLFVARVGARWRALAARRRPERRGLFVLAEAAGERRGWVHEGLVLPVADCTDPALRGALAEAVALLCGDGPADGLAERRRRAEARLAEAGLPATLPAGPVPGGFVELAPLHRLFPLLHQAFRYVTELSDDPTGAATVTESRPLPWARYGDFLEWQLAVETDDPDPVHRSALLLVAGNTGAVGRWLGGPWERLKQRTPPLRPDRFFALRPDVADAPVAAGLRLDGFGWAVLDLTLGDATLAIDCSEVYPPFRPLIGWLKRIDAGDLPAALEIDEEGEVKELCALPTGDPRRVLLLVGEAGGDTALLQGVVGRAALVGALKRALFAFFTTDFDPEHWYEHDGEDPEGLPERILADPWFDDLRGAAGKER